MDIKNILCTVHILKIKHRRIKEGIIGFLETKN